MLNVSSKSEYTISTGAIYVYSYWNTMSALDDLDSLLSDLELTCSKGNNVVQDINESSNNSISHAENVYEVPDNMNRYIN